MSNDQRGAVSPSVLLASLPWTSLTEPSLGLGILRAVLDQKGIDCRVLHLNLFLLEHLRAATYQILANIFSLNDFIFSGVLDPALSRKQEQWLRLKTEELLSYKLIDKRQYDGLDGVVRELLRLRQEIIPTWLSQRVDEIIRSKVTLVGLTCMFDQTIASVALAHLLKERAPHILVALGGYAVRPPTGEALLRAFPCIDAICVGEGEHVIEPLARASAGELPLGDVKGILYRAADNNVRASTPAPPVDMNLVPDPNYDDFFVDLRTLSETHQIDVEVERLPVENSRGCWWGQVKHCVFCGINDEDMAYRSRDGARALEGLNRLHERYGFRSFRFADYILPYQYYRTLLPELARRGKPYRITAEIKANVNPQRFALLAEAGFDEVQPGIESFSSKSLRSMDKGVSAVQNVHTLLLGKRHGLTVHYNLLYGFPDDEEGDYENLIRLLPRLLHLDPPSTRLPVQVTRYAPLQTDPKRFGIPATSYEPSYDLIFSEGFLETSGFDLNDFCYYYDRPFENSPHLSPLYREIDRLVDVWKKEQAKRDIVLWYEEKPGTLEIYDSRSEPPVFIELDALERDVYLTTLEPTTVKGLSHRLNHIDESELSRVLSRLDSLGLLFKEDEHVVGLALPRHVYASTSVSAEQVENSYSLT
jgi:ribosomal peptide maturation radical SAM protein 1